jgi:hypothetical protein
MKYNRVFTLNIFAIITVALALYLGFSGLVSWWIILLVGISHVSYKIDL